MTPNKNKHLFSFSLFFLLILFVETTVADTKYRVRSADSLNSIVEQFYPTRELAKSQIMVGILAENPRAFKGGNINSLMRGRRLNLPSESKMANVSLEGARALLKQHNEFSRRGIKDSSQLLAPIFEERLTNIPDSATLDKKQGEIQGLENEREALKKRFELLAQQKKEQDQKIKELEVQIQNIRKESSHRISNVSIPVKPEVLKVEKNQPQDVSQKEQSDLSVDKPVFVEQTQIEINAKNAKNAEKEEISAPRTESSTLLSKLFWILPLLLLGLVAYLFLRKQKRFDDNDDDIASIIATNNEDFEHNHPGGAPDVEHQDDMLETSVKLDVARAYIEADDRESAMNALDEVLKHGNADERNQARDLLESIC